LESLSDFYLHGQILLTGGMALGCALNALTAPRAEKLSPPRGSPKVSLLIPARNEGANLPFLLPCLERLRWEDLEILVLDDHSEDDTRLQLERAAKGNKRLRILSGSALPPQWLGKNWACQQLSEAARGDILLFCDADTRPAPDAITRTVSLLEKYGTGMASFIPRQILGTWSEKAVIPVLLHLSCCSSLPIALIPHFRWPALGVANGQWLAFTRPAYAMIGGHRAVRDHVVEDLALARLAQTTGTGLVLALASHTLEVRMYRDFKGVWEGFGKNLFILGTPRMLGWLPLLAIFLWAQFAPFLTAFWALARTLTEGMAGPGFAALGYGPIVTSMIPMIFLFTARTISGSLLREPWSAILWQPVGALLVPIIAAASRRKRASGRLAWKGRLLATSTPPLETYP